MNEQNEDSHERNAVTVGDARTATFLARPAFAWSVAMAVGGLFLALVGATDSYSLPLWVRLLTWLCLCGVAGVLGFAFEGGLLRAGVSQEGAAKWWAILTLALALAMTPIVYLANSLSGPSTTEMVPVYLRNSIYISAALVALRLAVGELMPRSFQTEEEESRKPPLLDRLPLRQHYGVLWAIGAEGHYSRIHTDLGSDLILLRLKDAMAEVGNVEGMQVHRSWWVARSAVAEVRSGSGRIRLVLKNSQEVPVSRSRRGLLRDAGWM